VWRVEGLWETETYQAIDGLVISEERTHGSIAVGDWLSGQLRYEMTAGLDSWNGSRRAGTIGGTVERVFLGDRIALSGSAQFWAPLSAERAFHTSRAAVSFRSSEQARGMVHLARFVFQRASDAAPHTLWPGAGDGYARPLLLRGHALLRDGVIAGPAFGRQVAAFSLETERWLVDRPLLPRLGFAAFIDMAHARHRSTNATGRPFLIDAGFGMRMRLPGRDGTLRVDYGRGLRDDAKQLTVGWQFLARASASRGVP
jgi:hypothetical protein